MVLGLEELVVVGVANPDFIYPTGAGGPSPVARSGLRAGVFDAQRLSDNLGGRSIDCQILSLTDKVHPFEVMFVAQVIVDLCQTPINRVVVGQIGEVTASCANWEK